MAATAGVVDFTNVKEGGNFKPRRKKEGDYRAKVVKADDHQPNDKSKAAGWVLTVQVEGDARSTYPIYLSPDPKQSWKIMQVCRAAGLNIKNSKVRFDPNKLVNKAIGIYLEDDEYEGRLKSTIAECFPVAEVGANADEDAPEDIDEIEDEEYEDEPEEEEEEEEEEEPPPAPKKRAVRRKPEPEPEPEEEEEEEEEPAPRKRVAAKKAVAPTRRKATPPPADEDEDEDLDLDELDEE